MDDRPPLVSVGRSALRHPIVVLVPVLIGLAAGAYLGDSRPTQYTASAQMSIGRIDVGAAGALAGFALATQSLASSYSRAIGGDAVVRQVAGEVHLPPATVRRRLSATPLPQSPVLTITATAPRAGPAVAMANAATGALERYVTRLNRSNPDSSRLLRLFRSAAARYAKLARQQRSASATPAPATATPTPSAADSKSQRKADNLAADVQTALLRREALRVAYQTSQQSQSSTSLLQVLSPAGGATSDRRRNVEIFMFAGLLGGIIVGLGAATLLENRRVRRRAHA